MACNLVSWKYVEQCMDSKKDIYLVDLREEKAYRDFHIKGAVNIPMYGNDVWMNYIEIGKIPVFYCTRGGQSMLACSRLNGMGYDAMQVVGGIAAYRGKYIDKKDL